MSEVKLLRHVYTCMHARIVCRNIGMSEFLAVVILGCRNNELSEYWDVGILGCRNIWLSEYWAIGILGCRNIIYKGCNLIIILNFTIAHITSDMTPHHAQNIVDYC